MAPFPFLPISEFARGQKISRFIPSPGPFHPMPASIGTSPLTRRRELQQSLSNEPLEPAHMPLNSRSSTVDLLDDFENDMEDSNEAITEPEPTSAWRARYYDVKTDTIDSVDTGIGSIAYYCKIQILRLSSATIVKFDDFPHK